MAWEGVVPAVRPGGSAGGITRLVILAPDERRGQVADQSEDRPRLDQDRVAAIEAGWLGSEWRLPGTRMECGASHGRCDGSRSARRVTVGATGPSAHSRKRVFWMSSPRACSTNSHESSAVTISRNRLRKTAGLMPASTGMWPVIGKTVERSLS